MNFQRVKNKLEIQSTKNIQGNQGFTQKKFPVRHQIVSKWKLEMASIHCEIISIKAEKNFMKYSG